MTTIDFKEVLEEIVIFLRNQNVFSTTQRGVTTITEEFDGDGLITDFTLTQTGVRNVRSVTVGGTTQSLGTDYTVDYKGGTTQAIISFTTAPGAGTDNVDIQYDYGTGDKIFSGIPRTDITIANYPLIGVQITSVKTIEYGLGGDNSMSNVLFTIYVYDDNADDVNDYVSTIRQKIIDNKKNFYQLKYVKPIGTGPLISEPDRGDKIVQRSIDFDSPFNVEN